ncbi:MAG: outer membrane protein transport protein [Pseudomonadota bacterium]
MKKNYVLSMAVTAAIALPSVVMATNGMMPMGLGSKAKGMAGAGLALPQDATAAASNPAGMAFVGDRIDFGLEFFMPDREASMSGNFAPVPDATGNPTFFSTDFNGDGNNNSIFYIPEGGFNTMINDRMSFGVSVVGVGGMNTNYDSVPMFNGAAGPNQTGINLEQLKIIPTLAYKFNSNHAVGIGIELGYQQFKAYGLQGFTGQNTAAIPGFPAGSFYDQQFSAYPDNLTNKGIEDSYGIGVSLGWTGKVTNELTLAATYHSKTKMGKLDDYKGLFRDGGSLDMPAWYGLGLAFDVSPKMTIAFDWVHTDYGSVDSISTPYNSGNFGTDMFQPANLLGTANGSGFGWDDVDTFKLGGQYEVSNAFTVRAGYSYSTNPIDSSQTLLNVLAPAVIKHHVSIGGTWVLENKSEITMFYYHAFNNKVEGDTLPAGLGGGSADISMSQNAMGIAYGWNF